MNYRNEKHRTVFTEAANRMDQNNRVLTAAFWLTADHQLWNRVGRYAERNEIHFDKMKRKDSTECAYLLLSAAEDLYHGASHLIIADLTDANLVSPMMLDLIYEAMKIRRFGTREVDHSQKKTENQIQVFTRLGG